MQTYAFIAFGFFVAVLVYGGKKKIHRRAACFALYRVRDNLVCLVAEGKLDESSRIFQYYYSRCNSILGAVPKVGFDHALESFISMRKNVSFEEELQRNRKTISDLQKLPEMQLEEVRGAVADFYGAISQVMIAHSSLSRFFYLKLMHDSVLPLISRVMPDLSRHVRVAKFAADESNALSPSVV